MFFSGISDEAGASIDTQIKAHRELGWSHLELRNINGQNLVALSDADFDFVYDAVTAAGMKVSCFASAIANWARNITGSFDIDVDDLRRAIPRMHRFGTPFIRIMSYPNDTDNPLAEPQWRAETIRRIRELSKMAEDGGITLLHENCSGWAGESPENTLVLLEEVDSPALKLVFDTGNPIGHDQDVWDYYEKVRDHIVYVHIKDAKKGEDGKYAYCYCGDGDGCVRAIVEDLRARGYDGGFSIEPHIAAVVHSGQKATPEELYASYVEYGRRIMGLA